MDTIWIPTTRHQSANTFTEERSSYVLFIATVLYTVCNTLSPGADEDGCTLAWRRLQLEGIV